MSDQAWQGFACGCHECASVLPQRRCRIRYLEIHGHANEVHGESHYARCRTACVAALADIAGLNACDRYADECAGLRKTRD